MRETSSAKNATSASPRLVMKMEFAGEIGDKWFADTDDFYATPEQSTPTIHDFETANDFNCGCAPGGVGISTVAGQEGTNALAFAISPVKYAGELIYGACQPSDSLDLSGVGKLRIWIKAAVSDLDAGDVRFYVSNSSTAADADENCAWWDLPAVAMADGWTQLELEWADATFVDITGQSDLTDVDSVAWKLTNVKPVTVSLDGLQGYSAAAGQTENRLVDAGDLVQRITEMQAGSVGDVSITLRDEDRVLRAYMQATDWHRTPVTVYQHFAGGDAADLVPLVKGVVNSPVSWSEATATVTFDVTDLSTSYGRSIGTIATDDLFPDLTGSGRGRMLPLVFGEVTNVPLVPVTDSAKCRLVRTMFAGDTEFYVDNSSDFPQDTTIQVRIGEELIEGHFEGSRFLWDGGEVGREVALHPTSGTVTTRTDSADHWAIKPEEGFDYATNWVGLWLKLTLNHPSDDDWDKDYYVIIVGQDSEAGELLYRPAIWWPYEDVIVPAGTTYAIVGPTAVHQAGKTVSEHLTDGWVYVANDASSDEVVKVEVWGEVHGDLYHYGERVVPAEQGWITLDPSYYTVNTNNTTSFPDVGHALTTIHMAMPVERALGYQHTLATSSAQHLPRPGNVPLIGGRWLVRRQPIPPDTPQVRAHVKGMHDAGEVLENPADAIEHVLENYMGLGAAAIDSASFTNARTMTQFIKFGFTLTDPVEADDLISDLAFQARCALVWEGERAKLVFLYNKMGDAATTIGASKYVADSVEIGQSEFADVVTELIGRWVEDGESRSITRRNADVESIFGRHTRELNLWAHTSATVVEKITQFWLDRWSHIYEIVNLETYLQTLELERTDAVELDLSGLYDSGQKAEVIAVDHRPGIGRDRTMDTLKYRLRIPRWPGCSSTCEMAEETGCATYCEIAGCQTGGETDCATFCETDCQTPAELFCVTSAEYRTRLLDGSGCGSYCQSSCTASCTSSSQTEDRPIPPAIHTKAASGAGTGIISKLTTGWGDWTDVGSIAIIDIDASVAVLFNFDCLVWRQHNRALPVQCELRVKLGDDTSSALLAIGALGEPNMYEQFPGVTYAMTPSSAGSMTASVQARVQDSMNDDTNTAMFSKWSFAVTGAIEP